MLKKILKGLLGKCGDGGVKPLGQAGEDMAVEYLSKKGFKILERNFRTRHGEIDIVCMHGTVLVFVEVKTRKSFKFGSPKDAVGRGKISRFTTAAKQYMARSGYGGTVRFDVLAIVRSGEDTAIEHIEGAFDVSE
ncbi:MAG: YraN family protein [Deltaproteobacteria bacterium]|nr:YraN family protein [Deltaproteobacteria bacterium]